MNQRTISFVVPLAVSLLAFGTSAFAQDVPTSFAKEVVIEAEASPRGEVVTDTAASGGKYVRKDGDYQPVFSAPLPSGLSDEVTVWVRYRGHALQLKGVSQGKQSELQWIWEKPESFKWASFGRFSKAKLGDGIVIIRAPGGTGGVDAVVLASDTTFHPDRDLKLPTAGASGTSAVGPASGPAMPALTDRQMLVEAEADPKGDTAADPGASGGKFVSRGGAYQPVFGAPVPGKLGDEITVWARHRGVSIQLKSVKDGKQTEKNWAYDKPAAWKWSSLGRHRRADLGDTALIIRGPDGDGGVDAVIFSGDAAFDPARGASGSTAPATTSAAPPSAVGSPVTVSVDWSAAAFTTNRNSFGLNAFKGYSPNVVANPQYQANLAYMSPGIIRIHNWGVMNDASKSEDGWIDQAGKRWVADRILTTMAAWKGTKAQLLINIPGWPDWMDKNGDKLLDRDEYDNYARFCADLVRIVNIAGKAGVRYWEITNERDDVYWVEPMRENKPDQLKELVEIFNRCSRAMKMVDPTIQTGGPAAARGDLLSYLRRFVEGTLPNLDFFSFHAYAVGSASDSDERIYNRSTAIGKHAADITKMLREVSPNRQIPSHLNEHNISWTWTTRDERMKNNKGAVWDALTLMSVAAAGTDVTNAWNERDGIYGKMAPDHTLRPSAHFYALANRYLVGQAVKTVSDDEIRVVAWAVKGGDRRTVLVVNRSDSVAPIAVRIAGDIPAATAAVRHSITEEGLSTQTGTWGTVAGAGWQAPAHSVTLITYQP